VFVTAEGIERPSFLLVHDHERKRDPEPDSPFMRTGLDTGVAMPALILVGNNGKFTLA
jgi:hypothetical protein